MAYAIISTTVPTIRMRLNAAGVTPAGLLMMGSSARSMKRKSTGWLVTLAPTSFALRNYSKSTRRKSILQTIATAANEAFKALIISTCI
ncbi:MAG: hypothetical protein Q9192_004761 [Flavoplaca navasiana]